MALTYLTKDVQQHENRRCTYSFSKSAPECNTPLPVGSMIVFRSDGRPPICVKCGDAMKRQGRGEWTAKENDDRPEAQSSNGPREETKAIVQGLTKQQIEDLIGEHLRPRDLKIDRMQTDLARVMTENANLKMALASIERDTKDTRAEVIDLMNTTIKKPKTPVPVPTPRYAQPTGEDDAIFASEDEIPF